MAIITIMRPTEDKESIELGIGEEIDFIFHGTKDECEEYIKEHDGPAYRNGEYHLIEKNLIDIEQ